MKRLLSMLIASLSCWSVTAAPLDALLTADHRSAPGELELEVGYDLVNSTVDVFNIRSSDTTYAGTNVGDYHGAHVRAGFALTRDLWVDGALWQRGLDYRTDLLSINTWQVGAQYRLLDAVGQRPAVALRLGAWGNTAGELKKSSPSTAQGITLDSVTVDKPKDIQLQMDLIGTARITPSTDLSVFGGAGVSQVSIKSVSATSTLLGCQYNLAFGVTGVTGQCSHNTDGFYIPNSAYGIDVFNEAQYRASFVTGGFSMAWQGQDWQVRGGYQFQHLNRSQIDSTIQARGGSAYQDNHILIGEVMYRLLSNTALVLRGQYMSNQFVGEMPFAYNTLTASRFDKRYGLLSTGLVMSF